MLVGHIVSVGGTHCYGWWDILLGLVGHIVSVGGTHC